MMTSTHSHYSYNDDDGDDCNTTMAHVTWSRNKWHGESRISISAIAL